MTIVETVADPAFRADILQCFETDSHAISARWLYDRRGSEIFEEITKIPGAGGRSAPWLNLDRAARPKHRICCVRWMPAPMSPSIYPANS